MAVEKSLLVRIGADTSELKAKLGKANTYIQQHSAQFRKAGMAMTAAGGAIVGAVGLMIKGYVAAGDEVHKMSLRTGLSTEALSELKYAAELSGTSLATVEKGVKKMASSIGEAKLGLKTYTDAFELIGMEVEELDGLNPEEQFMRMAKGIAEIEDPSQRAYAAQKLLGRAGTELLPLFAAGAEGMEAMRQEARDLGLSISELAAKKAAQLNDSMTKMKGAIKGVTMSIADKLVPVITSATEWISKTIQKVKDWMEAHPGLTKVIAIVVLAIGGLLLILGPLLIMLPALSAGFAMLWTAILGPIGLVIAAIALVAVGAYLIIKNWTKIKTFFIGLWMKVKELFFGLVTFVLEKIVWLMEKLSKIPLIGKFVKGIQEGLEGAKASMAAAKEKMKADAEAWAKEMKKSGDKVKESLDEVGGAAETMKIGVSSLYKAMTDEIYKATHTEYENSKRLLEQKYAERKALIEKEIEENKASKADLELAEQAHELAMAEIKATADEEKRLKQEEHDTAVLETKQSLADSLNLLTKSALENELLAIEQEFKAREAQIEALKLSDEEAAKLIADAKEERRLKEEDAEQTHADKMTRIQEATVAAMTGLYGDFLSDTLDAMTDWSGGVGGVLKGIGGAFKNLAKAAIGALKDIAIQEAVSAAKTFIAEKAKAIAKVISSVMSLPFPLNILAVGGAIAAVALLFSKIKLFGEGGIAWKPTLAIVGEKGPEAITPLSKAGAGIGGGFTLQQSNYFYGNISNVGDLDEISKRLGERARRAVEKGRK